MSSPRRQIIFVALILSLVAHFGAMIWAKPRVMTHVAAGIARLAHHGPVRITRHAMRPEPVALETVRDVAPEKAAPDTEATQAVWPAEATALPAEPKQVVQPTLVRPEEILSIKAPEIAAPQLAVAVPKVEAPPRAQPKMALEAPAVPALSASAPPAMPPHVSLTAAPVFEAPVFAPVGHVHERQEVVKITPPEPVKKPVFKPVEEVMATVDEKVVEAEKQAVRDLIDSTQALDMHAVADVALAVHLADRKTYFKATIIPKPRLPAVPKDVVILIDASGSIGNDRLASCRKAAREILRTAMNTGDRFNVVAFRDRFSYCFTSWQRCEAASFAAADKWMTRLAAHGRTDVFSTISSVLTLPRNPTRPLIALVVTDGDANTGVSETADILSKFSALNDGLISVYMYGVKSASNRELIDVLTHGNRGESFIFEGWRWNAGDGIGRFSERFRDPIVTDMRVVFPARCPAVAYPLLLKNLYRGNTVELVGCLAGHPAEIALSLRGIAGSVAYEGFYRLNVATARKDSTLPGQWRAEEALSRRLK